MQLYVKHIILLFILFIGTVITVQFISDFVNAQNYFAVSMWFMLGMTMLFWLWL
jgi:hypothetical protein